jgi:hypothetical protein
MVIGGLGAGELHIRHRLATGSEDRSDPYFTDTPQMSRQYSRMVRSDEK